MSNMAKQKGKRGEREFGQVIANHLGERIVVDPQGNGADILAIPGLSIEVKRQETLVVKTWWRQAQRQADSQGDIPVLAYRQNRGQWKVCLPAYLLTLRDRERFITVELDTFLHWLTDWLS